MTKKRANYAYNHLLYREEKKKTPSCIIGILPHVFNHLQSYEEAHKSRINAIQQNIWSRINIVINLRFPQGYIGI